MSDNNKRAAPQVIVPPLMWAGGKRWIAPELRALLPKTYGYYFEPFVGGGAAFFQIRPRHAVLSDANGELIATYEAIQEEPEAVWRMLRRHAQRHSDDYYYLIRSARPTRPVEIAARLLYLNRTCWNGLYRVNLSGHFNVPRGSKDQVLMDTDDPAQIANALRRAELVWSDFEMIVDCAGRRDVVYADPPYTVKHNFNGFLKYNESIFTWADQERLAISLNRARRRGAIVFVSNANHKSIRDLYRDDFELRTVQRRSVISADAASRGTISELLIIGRP